MNVAGLVRPGRQLAHRHVVLDVPRDPAPSTAAFRIDDPVAAEVNGAAKLASADGASARRPSRRRRPWGDELASWMLRLSLVFVFTYAAMSSFLDPATFAGYFPSFLPRSWATDLLPWFAGYEMLLVVGLLSGRYTYPAAVLSALTLAGITVSNPDAFEVLFRNVAIACAAVALAIQARTERSDARPERLQPAVADETERIMLIPESRPTTVPVE